MTAAEARLVPYFVDLVTVRLPIGKEEESRQLAIMLLLGNAGSPGVVSAVVVNTSMWAHGSSLLLDMMREQFSPRPLIKRTETVQSSDHIHPGNR
jgi:hypothetical protein